jgi:hypothetical protein
MRTAITLFVGGLLSEGGSVVYGEAILGGHAVPPLWWILWIMGSIVLILVGVALAIVRVL